MSVKVTAMSGRISFAGQYVGFVADKLALV